MDTEKLLDKLTDFLGADRRKQERKHENLKKLLKKLKKRQVKYKGMLEAEKNSGERKHLERTLKVIYAQRKKGIRLCKEISRCHRGKK